jgi:hypothetical protein
MENTEGYGISQHFVNLFSEIKKYLEIRYDLAKLDFVEKSIILTSALITTALTLFLFMFFLFFLSFGIAYYIGKSCDNYFLGFLIVSAFYFAIFIFVLLTRDKLIKMPVTHYILKVLFRHKKVKADSYED